MIQSTEVGGAAEARREDVGGVRGEALVDGRRRVVGAGNLAAIGVCTDLPRVWQRGLVRIVRISSFFVNLR